MFEGFVGAFIFFISLIQVLGPIKGSSWSYSKTRTLY
uniref:Uncharacterized protein n=1 Tax=Setaria italica TaxID=4555 RepID=K3YF01_SETIT